VLALWFPHWILDQAVHLASSAGQCYWVVFLAWERHSQFFSTPWSIVQFQKISIPTPRKVNRNSKRKPKFYKTGISRGVGERELN